ncbi:type II secretion system F family protein [Isoptericola sp. BMS4]|uniref:type II secretion system F family protein n=1 Tax=Isoptericola sp. BMS4 TaxID=2527875 RepID=UPI00141EFA3E|nr:type II secretion system F family protein [Isoptericola sp. BMS4]
MTAGALLATAAPVALLALCGAAPWWASHAGVRRRARRVAVAPPARPAGPGIAARVELPVLLELLAAAVRAGAGVPRALAATGDAVGGAEGAALRDAATALRLGAPWEDAWRSAPARLAPLHRALRSAWSDGAAPADALRTAREEVLHARSAAARTAAARLAVRLVLPLGACFLPAFVLVGLAPVLIALGIDLLSG